MVLPNVLVFRKCSEDTEEEKCSLLNEIQNFIKNESVLKTQNAELIKQRSTIEGKQCLLNLNLGFSSLCFEINGEQK